MEDLPVDRVWEDAQTREMVVTEALDRIERSMRKDRAKSEIDRLASVMAGIRVKILSLPKDLPRDDPWRLLTGQLQDLGERLVAAGFEASQADAKEAGMLLQRGWMMLQFERDARNQSSNFPYGSGDASKRVRVSSPDELLEAIQRGKHP